MAGATIRPARGIPGLASSSRWEDVCLGLARTLWAGLVGSACITSVGSPGRQLCITSRRRHSPVKGEEGFPRRRLND